jgi:predicted transcriptional regulator of viral defense system
MKLDDFINKLLADGQYSFSIGEVMKASEADKAATLNALHRLKQKKVIVSPAKGFYLIVPPQYQSFGCLPADMFVPDLMHYLNLPYYVGFLSAAQYYGAAHQKPQRFQVVTSKYHRPIHCGRILIEFIVKRNLECIPTNSFNSAAGTLLVSSPEVTALDLISTPQYGAGISNVATVVSELAEHINGTKLLTLSTLQQELFWVQRLGYLFEFLGFENLADILAKVLANKELHWVRLVSNATYKNITRNKKWKIIVNTKIEPDL